MLTHATELTTEGAPRKKNKPPANRTGIPDSLKHSIESSSGFSFDDVRIHYNSDKPAQLQALAYTQGNRVFIGPGNEKYLSHELVHVVQQKEGRVAPAINVNGFAVNNDERLEREADSFSTAQFKAHGNAGIHSGVNVIQMAPKPIASEVYFGHSEMLDRLPPRQGAPAHRTADSLNLAVGFGIRTPDASANRTPGVYRKELKDVLAQDVSSAMLSADEIDWLNWLRATPRKTALSMSDADADRCISDLNYTVEIDDGERAEATPHPQQQPDKAAARSGKWPTLAAATGSVLALAAGMWCERDWPVLTAITALGGIATIATAYTTGLFGADRHKTKQKCDSPEKKDGYGKSQSSMPPGAGGVYMRGPAYPGFTDYGESSSSSSSSTSSSASSSGATLPSEVSIPLGHFESTKSYVGEWWSEPYDDNLPKNRNASTVTLTVGQKQGLNDYLTTEGTEKEAQNKYSQLLGMADSGTSLGSKGGQTTFAKLLADTQNIWNKYVVRNRFWRLMSIMAMDFFVYKQKPIRFLRDASKGQGGSYHQIDHGLKSITDSEWEHGQKYYKHRGEGVFKQVS